MYRYIKRLFDILLAVVGGLVCVPLFVCIVIAVRIDSPGPVLFTQKRVGRGKRFFTIYKFRTMFLDTPAEVPTHQLDTPDGYITRTGRFLRRTSLDELPQLWNILKGDMSLVGPRPALWNQYDLIEARDRYVGRYGLTPNTVRPGLTGWAQINGRDELTIAQKARLDGEYVVMFGFATDVRCVLQTVKSVAEADGVVEGGAENGGRQKEGTHE